MFERWRFERALKPLATAEDPVLRDYADADWPSRGSDPRDAACLALDFELDGLAREAAVLQAGWITFRPADSVTLSHAQSKDIRSNSPLDAKAVTIHGIGEQRAQAGEPIEQVFRDLVAVLCGRIVVAHGALIEEVTIKRMTKQLFSHGLPVRSICTMAIERKLHPQLVGSEPYRLAASRARYGLPEHDQHDALGDALAAAELFLAQLAHLPRDTSLGTLEDLRI